MSGKTLEQQNKSTASRSGLSSESIELLLSEHERLSLLLIENHQMGERRTSLYLTLITIACPVAAAVGQYFQSGLFTAFNAATLGILLIIGLLTFSRLIERLIIRIELLRAINRIHQFFVDRDSALADYLAWPADKTFPPFEIRMDRPIDSQSTHRRITKLSALPGSVMHRLKLVFLRDFLHIGRPSGLRDIVQILNSLLAGLLIPSVISLQLPSTPAGYLVGAAFFVLVLAWGVQQWYESAQLNSAQRRADEKAQKQVNGNQL